MVIKKVNLEKRECHLILWETVKEVKFLLPDHVKKNKKEKKHRTGMVPYF